MQHGARSRGRGRVVYHDPAVHRAQRLRCAVGCAVSLKPWPATWMLGLQMLVLVLVLLLVLGLRWH
jgi:hypothetical protein